MPPPPPSPPAAPPFPPPPEAPHDDHPEQATWFAQTFAALADNVERAVLGKRHVVELVLTAMLSEGHVLLEDVPGTGKTSLARAVAQSVQGTTTRIQFTPDLLPGDITGITVYDQKTGEFSFHEGPVFANIVLADEINRASPKTQAALEVMEEGTSRSTASRDPSASPSSSSRRRTPSSRPARTACPKRSSTGSFCARRSATPTCRDGADPRPGRRSDRRARADHHPGALAGMAELAADVYVDALVLDYIARIVDATRSADEVRLGVSIRGARAHAGDARRRPRRAARTRRRTTSSASPSRCSRTG
jgi:MoxR-like ATPase